MDGVRSIDRRHRATDAGAALNRAGQTSVCPRQDLFQVCKELLPPVFGALVGLLLIRPEARLLHAQAGPRARRGESPGDDTLETTGTPRGRERFSRLDSLHLAANTCRARPRLQLVSVS